MHPTKPLGEICQIKTGKKDANYSTEDGKYPFFTCGREILKAPGYSFDADVILIAGNGDVGTCKKFKGKFEAYQRTYVLFGFQGINKDFLFYFLEGNLKKELLKETLGSAIPYIKLGSLQKRMIPLPPLPVQQKIVKKLDTVLEKIEKNIELTKQNLANIEEQNKSILEKIFRECEEEFEMKKLGEFLVLNYGKSPEKNKNGEFEVYGANGVMYKSGKFLYDGKSIIVGRKGSAGALNKVEGKFWASDVTYFVTSFQNIDFIYFCLEYLNLKKLAKGVKPGINRNDIYGLQIPLPSLPKQQEIVAYLDRIFEKNSKLKNLYEKNLKNLEELKQSVLKEAFENEDFIQ